MEITDEQRKDIVEFIQDAAQTYSKAHDIYKKLYTLATLFDVDIEKPRPTPPRSATHGHMMNYTKIVNQLTRESETNLINWLKENFIPLHADNHLRENLHYHIVKQHTKYRLFCHFTDKNKVDHVASFLLDIQNVKNPETGELNVHASMKPLDGEDWKSSLNSRYAGTFEHLDTEEKIKGFLNSYTPLFSIVVTKSSPIKPDLSQI